MRRRAPRHHGDGRGGARRSAPRRRAGLGWLALATFIGAGLGLSSPTAADHRTDRLLRRADALRARGRDRAAWALVRRAATRAPDDPAALDAVSRALPEIVAWPIPDAQRDRAAEVRDLLRDHTQTPEHTHRLAWAEALAGDRSRAVTRLARAAGLQDGAAARWLRRLATLAVHAGELETAQAALQAAHRARPQDSEVLSDLGAVELALGHPEAAILHFERILGRHPENLGARRDLAGAFLAAGHAARAAEHLSRCIQAHPNLAPLRLEMAQAALEAGQPEVSERAARAAIERLSADDPRGWAALGDALVARGRPDAARQAYQRAQTRDAQNLRARRGLDALREPPPSLEEGAAGAR